MLVCLPINESFVEQIVFSFPTTFVVDRQGKIRYSLNQGVEWDIPEPEAPLVELLKQPNLGCFWCFVRCLVHQTKHQYLLDQGIHKH